MNRSLGMVLGLLVSLPLTGTLAEPKEEADGELAQMAERVVALVNEYRAAKGKSPLVMDERISQECRQHSQEMASGRRELGHNGFKQRIRNLQIAYRQVAENVASNQGHADPVAQALEDWKQSPGHNKNLLGNFESTGVGMARASNGSYYFTQIFLRPK